MSFLYKTTPLLRTSVARPTPRLFSTCVAKQNVVKDTAKAVDRTVSDQIVKGIDKGIEAKDAAAAAAGIETEKAKGESSKAAGEAQGKAAELKVSIDLPPHQLQSLLTVHQGQAKGKAEEIKGKMS
jgi:hypothetical protein